MKNRNILDIIILVFLFIGNIIIKNNKYYFILIYASLLLYNIFIIYSVRKNELNNKKEILWILFTTLNSYIFSYFMICDQNPIISIITYYIFFPDFFKAIIIIIFHTYFFSKYYIIQKYNYINNLNDKYDIIQFKKHYIYKRSSDYFLSEIINYFKKDKFNVNIISFPLVLLKYILAYIIFYK